MSVPERRLTTEGDEVERKLRLGQHMEPNPGSAPSG